MDNFRLGSQSGIIVIYDSDADQWEALLPGRCQVISPDDNSSLLDGTWPAQPIAIIINANLLADADTWKAGNSAMSSRNGFDLALRLRQEPKRFGYPIIFVSFERLADTKLDRNRRRNKRAETQLLLEAEDWAHCWLRLPASTEMIWAAITGSYDRFSARLRHEPTCLIDLANKAFGLAFANENRRFRHLQGTFCAAVRLLLGGLQAGTVKVEEAERILTEIEKRRGVIAPREKYDFGLVRRFFDFTRPNLANESPGVPKILAKRKMLVIDDEWESAGWDLVLPTLFPDWLFDGIKRYGEIQPSDLRNYHSVLLDFMMPESGITVLHNIRLEEPLLPVILFTGDRNASTFTLAVEWGANEVALKELADVSARDSLSYYKYLQNIVSEATAVDAAVLSNFTEIWRKIASLRAPAKVGEATFASDAEKKHLEEAINSFERALFFGAYAAGLAGNMGWAPANDARKWAARAVGIDLGLAMRAVCLAHDPSLEWRGLFSVEQEVSDFIKKGTWRGGNCKPDLARLTKAIVRSRHSLPTWSLGELLDYLRTVAAIIVTSCNSWRVRIWIPETLTGPPVANHATISARHRDTNSHETLSILGCVRFLLGYCCQHTIGNWDDMQLYWDLAGPGQSGRDVVEAVEKDFGLVPKTPKEGARNLLIIDDKADADGWLRAFEVCLDHFNLIHVSSPSNMAPSELCGLARAADIVLLDLLLPSGPEQAPTEHNGFAFLELIRKHARSTPIIIISSESNLLTARKSYARGAQYYFAKSPAPLPSRTDPSRQDFFKEYYNDLAKALRTNISEDFDVDVSSVRRRLSRSSRLRVLDSLKDRNSALRVLVTQIQGVEPVSSLLAEEINQEIELAERLSWIGKDPHAAAVWRYIIKSSTSAQPFEAIVRLVALIETIIKIIVVTAEAAAPSFSFSKTRTKTLGKLREHLAEHKAYSRLNGGSFSALLQAIASYRNGVLYRTRKASLQDFDKRRIIFKSIFEALDKLSDELILQAIDVLCASRAKGGALTNQQQSSREVAFLNSLRKQLNLENSLMQLDHEIKELWGNSWLQLSKELAAIESKSEELRRERERLEAQYKTIEYELSAASGELTTLNDRGWEMATRFQSSIKQKLERLTQKREDLVQRTSQLKQQLENIDFEIADTSAKRIQALQNYLNDQVASLRHEGSLLGQRSRWQCIKDWLHERELEQLTANALQEQPKPCGWDEASNEIDAIVDAFFKEHASHSIRPADKLARTLSQWAVAPRLM